MKYATVHAPANTIIMNAQLPRLSSAPPVRAWPLVHPRASAAPNAISMPPANAVARRGRTDTRGPFSVTSDAARQHPGDEGPDEDATTSNSSHDFSGW